jgi:hypothetical protein
LSTPGVNRHMEIALSGVHADDADMYPIIAPLELRAGIVLFSPSNLFYTYGSLMDGVAGFAVHHTMDSNIGFRMREPASVFSAELVAIHMAMDHIENEKALDLNQQYELDKGNGITRNLAASRSCTSVNKNVGNWHEVAVM